MTDRRGTSYGTGYQRTSIEPTGDGRFRWTRTPGTDNREGFRVPPPGFADQLGRLADGSAEFLAPVRADPRRVVWTTSGTTALAAVVQADPGGTRATEGVERLGRALRAFHRLPATDQALDPIATSLQRWAHWLSTGDGTRASRPWRVHLRSTLGPERWDLLVHATDALLAGCTGGPRRMVHGWLSLGNVVAGDVVAGSPTASLAPLQVLSGTDLATGCPEFDAGCLLGELAEFGLRAAHFDRDPEAFRRVSEAFLAGYGGDLDPGLLAAAKAVRIALHSCDFAAFLGWHSDLELYPAMIGALLDAVPVGCG